MSHMEDHNSTQSNLREEDKESEREHLKEEGEPNGSNKPDTSSALNLKDPTDACKQAAPQLLNELARLLSQHKWSEERCVPHRIVNILNCSWHQLTAGVLQLSPKLTDKSAGSLRLEQIPRQVSASAKEENAEKKSCIAGSAGFTERKTQATQNRRVKKSKQKSNTGWIIQPNQASGDEPQPITLCQWVVERLQGAKNPEKAPSANLDLKNPLILRHYGDAKAKLKHRRRKVQPATLVNGMPQIPEVKQRDPAQRKLHYRISDGSSFIYYPSGCMAVCQSHSSLPYGGFYTNVFTDSEFPVILATVTAFGHGAVTHPLSSAITALWDQNGGFICDLYGNITKEWSWQTDQGEMIVIQVSDLISVRLFSGMSAVLIFRCGCESVQLPLFSVSNVDQSKDIPCLRTQGKLISDSAEDLLLLREEKYPVLTLTHESASSQKAPRMAREVKKQERPAARWKRGGRASRTLWRLQQRVRKTVEDWLDYYRVAIGIKCPDSERMPDAPLRTRLRKEVQSAALPSLNPPEWAVANPVQPEESKDEFQELHRPLLQKTLSAPAERVLDSQVILPRTPKKHAKKKRCVTLVGPLRIYGNIKPESVILLNDPESQTSTFTHCPAVPPFPPSVPLTVCPDLLRAVLLGEGPRRRCCCSTKLMPVVTDLEYDAFIMGQPSHSQQIIVVCVITPHRLVNTHIMHGQDTLENLYRSKNKHRTTPCTQCQMDSFRLVRYEMETENLSYGSENILLRQRHSAAPGMVL